MKNGLAYCCLFNYIDFDIKPAFYEKGSMNMDFFSFFFS